MPSRVAVVGGGVSGLAAAYFALQRGHAVELFEQGGQLGGLAASCDLGGLRIEKFYHFICGCDFALVEFAKRLGIGEKIRFTPTKLAFFHEGTCYPFGTPLDLLRFSPLPLLSRVRFGLNVVSSKYSESWEELDAVPARQWLSQKIGERAYRVIWDPLLRIKFGRYADRISAAWVWHRIHRVASSRRRLLSRERMGYFEGGTETLIDAVADAVRGMGGRIHLRAKVGPIEKEGAGFRVSCNSRGPSTFDRVVMAVPLPVAANLVRGLDSSYGATLASIAFIGVVCGVFRLGENLTDAFWLNINDERIAANGLIEFTNLNPLPEIAPDKIVYVPFYVPVDSRWYAMSTAALHDAFLGMLRTVKPALAPGAVRTFRAFKSSHAQAICTVGFKDRIPAVATPVRGLYLLDSTQLYPSDRSLSALIALAERAVRKHL